MIPLFKVTMSPDAKTAVARILDSGYIGQGQEVELFEQEFGAAVDAPYPPLAVNSCTSALSLALKVIGVGPDDYVISTPMTCAATNAAIVMAGAQIVWADIDPATGLIDPDSVKERLARDPKAKAIMAVDWGGTPCDYKSLKEHGIPVIEDAAQAFGASIDGEPIARVGGDYCCWSFQAIKQLTTGDGGALLAPTSGQIERARLLRWYGLDRRSNVAFRAGQDIQEVGTKWHMNDIAAAVGRANLKLAVTAVKHARGNARYYDERFGEKRYTEGSSAWLYTLLVDSRDAFIAAMAEAGVEAGQVHARNDLMRGFRRHAPGNYYLPGVDAFAARQVSLPCGWWLAGTQREIIVRTVRLWQELQRKAL